jgi:hypothetical protein
MQTTKTPPRGAHSPAHARYLSDTRSRASEVDLGKDRVVVDEWDRPGNVPCGIIIPASPPKRNWDTMVLFIILYSAFAVPVEMCFDAFPEVGSSIFSFECLVSVIFVFDLLFSFSTAHLVDDSYWEVRRGHIAAKYLGGWFWIDMPASIPWEIFDLIGVAASDNARMLRLMRMFRLVRLLRLLKIKQYMIALEEQYSINLQYLRILQSLMSLIYLAHFLGCFFFALTGLHPEENWARAYDEDYKDRETWQLYIYSARARLSHPSFAAAAAADRLCTLLSAPALHLCGRCTGL